MQIKGWFRPQGGVTPSGRRGRISYKVLPLTEPAIVRPSDATAIASGVARLSPMGGFHISFDVPEAMRSGLALVSFAYRDEGGNTDHSTWYRVVVASQPESGHRAGADTGHAASAGQALPSSSSSAAPLTEHTLALVPDKSVYRAGDTAEVLVEAPFYPAYGYVRVDRGPTSSVRPIALTAAGTAVRVPITDRDLPDLAIEVSLSGRAPHGDKERTLPAHAAGRIVLDVSLDPRRLVTDVVLDPVNPKPGDEVSYHVIVTDASGAPVALAEVALFVFDAGISERTGHSVPDPLDVYFPPRIYPQRRNKYFRTHTRLAVQSQPPSRSPRIIGCNPAPTWAFSPRYDVSVEHGGAVLFEPNLVTDANGRVNVRGTLPDRRARYQVVAVSFSRSLRFGRGIASLTVQSPPSDSP